MVKHFWKGIALTIAERDFNGLNKQQFLNHKSILIEWCYFCETEIKKTDAMRKFLQWSHLLFFYIWNISWVQRSLPRRWFFLIEELRRARGTRELSPIAKKIWLSIHLRKFGSDMTQCPSTRTSSQWSLSSVDLEFRLRQKTLKDIFFRMCL